MAILTRVLCMGLLVGSGGCHDFGVLRQSFCATMTQTIDGKTSPPDLCDGFDTTAGIDGHLWQVDITPLPSVQMELRVPGPNTFPDTPFRGPGALFVSVPADAHAELVQTTVAPLAAKRKPGEDTVYLAVQFQAHLGGTVPPGDVRIISVLDDKGVEVAAFGLKEGQPYLKDSVSGRIIGTGRFIDPTMWHCSEFRIGNDITLWGEISRGPLPMLVIPDFVRPASLSTVRFGLSRGADGHAEAASAWLDEVAIETQTIGCPG